MTVSVATIRPRVLYRLRVSELGGSLELLRWTFATEDVPAALSSAAGLPHELLQAIQRNLQALLAQVDADDQQDQQELLALVSNVRDGRGAAVASALAGEGYLALELGDLDASVTYYLYVGIPHSLESPLC